MNNLLEIKNLVVKFRLPFSELTALAGINLKLAPGERLGLVGESGAGKSVAGFSIINLISKPGYIHSGSVYFKGEKISNYSLEEMRHLRGNKISMIFQDPMMTLNPVLNIETQMLETILAHNRIKKLEARKIAIEKLKSVHIPSPEKRLKQYPHQLSGGMRQRIVIAIALLTNPELIIADEPTTALDVTIQAEIMNLLLELSQSTDMGLILITHDLGVVSQATERIAVMYAGRIVEEGLTDEVIAHPAHPYTQGLIQALPQSNQGGKHLNQIPGLMPSLNNIPPGCAFHPRCNWQMPICHTQRPDLRLAQKHSGLAACHLITST